METERDRDLNEKFWAASCVLWVRVLLYGTSTDTVRIRTLVRYGYSGVYPVWYLQYRYIQYQTCTSKVWCMETWGYTSIRLWFYSSILQYIHPSRAISAFRSDTGRLPVTPNGIPDRYREICFNAGQDDDIRRTVRT